MGRTVSVHSRRRYSRIVLQYFVCLVLSTSVWAAGRGKSGWRVVKGKHFLVYYRSDRGFAKETARHAEKHYRRIAADLGYVKYDKFWLWDERAKIYIYQSQSAFTNATGAPHWAKGKASLTKREVAGVQHASFVRSVLPHELAHLIFRDFVGFKGDVPLWLDEGVALWEEEDGRANYLKIASMLASANKLIPLAKLTKTDVRGLKNDKVVQLFYAQSACLVGFLIEQHGSAGFRRMCREIRDGKSLDNALKTAYPRSLRGMHELQTKWFAHLKKLAGRSAK